MSLPELTPRRSTRQTKGNPPERFGFTKSDFGDEAVADKSLELTQIRRELKATKLQLEVTLLQNKEANLVSDIFRATDRQESVRNSNSKRNSVCGDANPLEVYVPQDDGEYIPRRDILCTPQRENTYKRVHMVSSLPHIYIDKLQNQPLPSTSKQMLDREVSRYDEDENFIERDRHLQSEINVHQWLQLNKATHSTPFAKKDRDTNEKQTDRLPVLSQKIAFLEEELRKCKLHQKERNAKVIGHKDDESRNNLQYLDMMNTFVARQTKMDLPKFNGNPEDWPLFCSEFVRTTDCGKFTIQENVTRLRAALKDEALEAVKSLLILPDSSDRIMQILERRFGRPDYIIKSLLGKAKTIAAPREDNPLSIVKFATCVENLTVMLELMGRPEHPELLEELEGKLPPIFSILWSEHIVEKEKVNLRVFCDWLERKSHAASLRTTLFQLQQQPIAQKTEVKRTKGKVNAASIEKVIVESSKCSVCKSNCNSLDTCKKFLEMSVDERWQNVRKLSLCFACLKKNHQTRMCRKKSPCDINSCQRNHHRLLHNHQQRLSTEAPVFQPPNPQSHTAVANGFCTNGSTVSRNTTRLRILPVSLKNNSVVVNTFALLDPGATLTLISEAVANKLQMDGKLAPLSIQWANGDVANEDESKVGSVHISGTFLNARTYALNDVRTVKHLPLQRQSVDRERLIEKWPYLKEINFESYDNVQPTILIGENNGLLTATRQLIHNKSNNPIASRTWLGWTISGNDGSDKASEVNLVYMMQEAHDDDLHALVKSSFQLDDSLTIGCDRKRSREDERALNIMKTTTTKLEDCRWQTGLLWKRDDTRLPDSKFAARQRLYLLEKKLDKDPVLKKAYGDIIDDYLQKKYLVNAEDKDLIGSKTWYLPHFPVINPMKPHKIRIVFDAAARSNGIALNDELIQGPDLLQSLPGVLFKFRQGQFGFTADIKEMFHRVRIRDEDNNSQLILWRGENRTDNPRILKMTAMMFGATCSPSSAIYVKDLNADEYLDTYPEAVYAIKNNHYMDDYLGHADDEAAATALIEDVIRILRLGGFHITNWRSSSKSVLQNIPVDELAKVADRKINIDKNSESRILGVLWNTQNDSFTFAAKLEKIDDSLLNDQKIPTKRQVLKIVMSVFDPLGFVAHFVIVGKMLLQAIWKTSIDWDDELTEDLVPLWSNWVRDLNKISSVNIPRCYSPLFNLAPELELHVFVDASESGYAAVAYVRIVFENNINVSFVAAKAKVLPLKPIMTIPRAELQAAVLGSRLANTIKSQHDRKFKKVLFWTDSTTVYHWIKSEAKRFKQFVANRLSEISDLTNIADWNWLPTNLNVADDATRMTPKEFEADSRWYTGPSFLYEDVSMWPKMKTNKMTRFDEEDETNEFVGTISVPARFVLPNVMRFSNWSRLIRATAWIMRYKENLKIKGRITRGDEDAVYYQGELTTTEIEWANKLWIRQSQQNSFHKEIVELRKNKVVSRSSKLYNIIPQLDDEGIIRLRGRMSNIEGDQWLKTPVVLDGRDKYTELLIKYYHDQANHIGHEGVMNEIKQRYWILKLKPKLRQRRKLCNTCKIRCAKPENTIMGQLPAVRLLSNNPAFTFTGVDYFGPINVKVGRHLEKRYGVLFTCLTVRAIHIEVASSLTTDSCIMALRRFIARRGCPNELFSDNGTNLKGADTELKRCLKELDQSAIRGALTKHRIKWRFIPPAAPHMGGCWERLVRSVKTSLYAILKEVNPSDETLNTLLAEIEQIINSRPLVEVPYHPDEPEALTPNHFLIGRSSASAPISDFDDKDLILRKRWRMTQRLADHFWNRWRKEFLPNLNQQNKWKTQSGRDVQVGDVVLLFNDNEVRGNWPKGIIDKVFPGPDGKIRVVEVRTSSGTFKRSIVKVCVLDLEDGKSDEVPIPEGRMLSKSQT
ncbi:uncharacterized protein LOC129946907 [Eupeodes corollae]|uniref:uncharacterized protein LOC129946907 n=1 Tax=Eupeodes corollae TaxID=290404 RepID=UPI0024912785|nr:uncharacterized protein LOC129946907 [Eupeodes corollae]